VTELTIEQMKQYLTQRIDDMGGREAAGDDHRIAELVAELDSL
jgi:hypothetical protein